MRVIVNVSVEDMPFILSAIACTLQYRGAQLITTERHKQLLQKVHKSAQDKLDKSAVSSLPLHVSEPRNDPD